MAPQASSACAVLALVSPDDSPPSTLAAEAIAALPGLNGPTAHRLVELRDEGGGFSSAEEAGALLELSPVTVERLDRRAVFLPS